MGKRVRASRSKPAPLEEATNNPQKQKRVADGDSDLDEVKTPPKKQKKGASGKGVESPGEVISDDEGEEDSDWLLTSGNTMEV